VSIVLIVFLKKSSIAEAMNYISKNYNSLTRFIKNPDLPIDNNPQERLLRNPVIGRKSWYGTQTKLGVRTNTILFTFIESWKLCKVNLKVYFKNLVLRIFHNNEVILRMNSRS